MILPCFVIAFQIRQPGPFIVRIVGSARYVRVQYRDRVTLQCNQAVRPEFQLEVDEIVLDVR